MSDGGGSSTGSSAGSTADSGSGGKTNTSMTNRIYAPKRNFKKIFGVSPNNRVCTLRVGLNGKRDTLHRSPFAQSISLNVANNSYSGAIIIPFTASKTTVSTFNLYTVNYKNLEVSGSISITGSTIALPTAINWLAVMFVQRDGYTDTNASSSNLPAFSFANASAASYTTQASTAVGQKPYGDVVFSQQGCVTFSYSTTTSAAIASEGFCKKICWNDKNINIKYLNLLPGDQLIFILEGSATQGTLTNTLLGNFYVTLDYIRI